MNNNYPFQINGLQIIINKRINYGFNKQCMVKKLLIETLNQKKEIMMIII